MLNGDYFARVFVALGIQIVERPRSIHHVDEQFFDRDILTRLLTLLQQLEQVPFGYRHGDNQSFGLVFLWDLGSRDQRLPCGVLHKGMRRIQVIVGYYPLLFIQQPHGIEGH
jgi:hypothetical protein